MSELRTGTDRVTGARRDGDALLAQLHGEIDLHNSPEIRTALLDLVQRLQPRRLVLNLADVPYMDSSAIAVLVETLKEMRKRGGRIFLTHLQPRVQGLLEIAKLDSIFVLAKDDQEAMGK